MKGLLAAAPRREEVHGAEGSPITRPHAPGTRPGCAAHLPGQPNPWPAPRAGSGGTKPRPQAGLSGEAQLHGGPTSHRAPPRATRDPSEPVGRNSALFPKLITASHGLLPTPKLPMGSRIGVKEGRLRNPPESHTHAPAGDACRSGTGGFGLGPAPRSAGWLAPLPPNAKELPAPNQAGPAGTPRVLPASSSPLPADEKSELPRTSAPLAPAHRPAGGTLRDGTRHKTAISPLPQTRQAAGLGPQRAPSLSETPPWRDLCWPSRHR